MRINARSIRSCCERPGCLALLQGIDRLPIVQVPIRDDLGDADGGPDDGKRMDYAMADQLLDKALDKALDLHVANRGFRRSLANFLLSELQNGTTNLTMYGAQYLLEDGGFRPIGSPAAASSVKAMPGDLRERLGLYAAAEIDAVGRMLRMQEGQDGFDLVLNGALIRINALSSVLLSLQGGDDGRDWDEMHEVVFGEKLEVAHG
ncbi:hypothetical protein [Roseateles sp.]|uniref:hypothetical protein n=1 Tax=Roseateles sp. TaxID=1971397 RepID=UPI003BABA42A